MLRILAGLALIFLCWLTPAFAQPQSALRLTGRFPTDSLSIRIDKAVAIDVDFRGNTYIIDRGRHQLLKFDAAGNIVRQIGGFGQGGEQFDDPRDVSARSTLDVYVADYNNNRVVRFDKDLNFLNDLNSRWPEPFNFEQVLSMAVSSQSDLFLLEDGERKIIKFNRNSEPAASFGGVFAAYGQLLEPTQLVIDGSSRLFVCDPGQGLVMVFDYLGNYLVELRHPDLQQPGALFIDRQSTLYVVDLRSGDIFLFKNGTRFHERLSIPAALGRPVDIARRQLKEDRPAQLLVLTRSGCLVFERTR